MNITSILGGSYIEIYVYKIKESEIILNMK